jgi:hypothetical protein
MWRRVTPSSGACSPPRLRFWRASIRVAAAPQLCPFDVEIAPPGPSSIQSGLAVSFVTRTRGDAMCPFCLASMGLIVASATYAGGLTVLAVKLSRKKKTQEKFPIRTKRSNPDVNPNSR